MRERPAREEEEEGSRFTFFFLSLHLVSRRLVNWKNKEEVSSFHCTFNYVTAGP